MATKTSMGLCLLLQVTFGRNTKRFFLGGGVGGEEGLRSEQKEVKGEIGFSKTFLSNCKLFFFQNLLNLNAVLL